MRLPNLEIESLQLTAEHLVLVVLQVFDGGVGVAQQRSGGLAAHAHFYGGDVAQASPAQDQRHQRCIHHQGAHHNARRPQCQLLHPHAKMSLAVVMESAGDD